MQFSPKGHILKGHKLTNKPQFMRLLRYDILTTIA